MKIDEKKIEQLRTATNRDYGFCERALIKNKGDYNKALDYILNYDDKPVIRLYKNASSILFGEKSYRFKIKFLDENIIDIPLLIPILMCVLIPIPSAFIGALLTIIIITTSSINIEMINNEEVKKPLQVKKTKKNVTHKIKTTKKINQEIGTYITKDEDGYNILTIK